MSQDQSASAAPFISPEKEAANLALWLHIWETDPGFTKSFSRTGGFKGTATNPTWLQMRATAVFGPKGIGWGTTELAVRIEGHEHYEYTGEKGEVVQVPPRKVWFTHLEFWYVHPVSGERGKVDQWGGTEFMGSNKYGPFIDDEAAKKSATDAMSKCMAAIGFAADVHLGMFDDNKYVADMAQKFQPFRRRRAGGDKPKGNESSNNGNPKNNGSGRAPSNPPADNGRAKNNPRQNGAAPPAGSKKPDDSVRICEDEIRDAVSVDRIKVLRAAIIDPSRSWDQSLRKALLNKCDAREQELKG